jgi:hypothetical protein
MDALPDIKLAEILSIHNLPLVASARVLLENEPGLHSRLRVLERRSRPVPVDTQLSTLYRRPSIGSISCGWFSSASAKIR